MYVCSPGIAPTPRFVGWRGREISKFHATRDKQEVGVSLPLHRPATSISTSIYDMHRYMYTICTDSEGFSRGHHMCSVYSAVYRWAVVDPHDSCWRRRALNWRQCWASARTRTTAHVLLGCRGIAVYSRSCTNRADGGSGFRPSETVLDRGAVPRPRASCLNILHI